jgi:hypothetical protein
MMSSEPSDQNREPVTRRLDELAQQVKYLRELIDSAYAEERRHAARSFLGLTAGKLHREIAGRGSGPGRSPTAHDELRNDQPKPKDA